MKRPTKGYWWECSACGDCTSFKDTTGKGSVASFIWDILQPSGWNQSLLVKKCANCGKDKVKITYDFPRSKRDIIQVNHIVGFKKENSAYIPMLWETVPNNSKNKIWYDFKYQNKRNNHGLNKPAVMQLEELNYLLKEFKNVTGTDLVT